MAKVVTRFAPSPTGFMHVGGVRTALFAWLFARQQGGTFILRIEDTDKAREVEGSIQHIQESLHWLGLNWNEGPYLQSERLESYKKYAQQLVEKGLAYPDPYSESEVEALRKKAEDEKRPFLYREYRPIKSEVWDGSKPLRFRVPEIKRYAWQDIVRGELSAGEEALDDFILIKSDGYPTYNFAHIVDDQEMGVTHIIRGEEFISSTPRFLSLYDALQIERPQFATMPVILGPSGAKKLSKRDGAKDILDYRAEGYLPEAMINFLAFLGWHPEGNEEVFTVSQLLEVFDLSRVQKGGAKFDEAKLLWLNHEHLKLLSNEEFQKRLQELCGRDINPLLIPLLKERAQTLKNAADALEAGEYDFLDTSVAVDQSLLLKGATTDAATAKKHLGEISNLLADLSDEAFTAAGVQEAIFPYATEQGRASVLWPLRTALSGKEKSPDPFTLAQLLGKAKTLERIATAIQIL